jgi:hypothetical protein
MTSTDTQRRQAARTAGAAYRVHTCTPRMHSTPRSMHSTQTLLHCIPLALPVLSSYITAAAHKAHSGSNGIDVDWKQRG